MSVLACLIAALTVAAPRDTLPQRLEDAPVVLRAPESAGAFEPSGIVVDAFGRVFVTDARAHRLVRFDPEGRWLGGEGTLGSDPGEFRRPGAVALHGTLELVVLDRENFRIARYDLLGHFLGVLVDFQDPALQSELGRIDPIDLASDRGGALAVADREGDRVLMFDVAGTFVRSLGGFGGAAGSLHGLAGLAFTPRGDLITVERIGARVQRLEPSGRVAAAWTLPGRLGDGALPVAVGPRERIAVADEKAGRLWLFDPAGRLIAERSGLAGPRALAFAPDSSLLVAESSGACVRRLTARATPADSTRAE